MCYENRCLDTFQGHSIRPIFVTVSQVDIVRAPDHTRWCKLILISPTKVVVFYNKSFFV